MAFSLSLSRAPSICPTYGGKLAFPKLSTFTQSGAGKLVLHYGIMLNNFDVDSSPFKPNKEKLSILPEAFPQQTWTILDVSFSNRPYQDRPFLWPAPRHL